MRWTKREISQLYVYAAKISQEEAGRLLGRSAQCIESKVRDLGIRWRQGTVSLNDIAKQFSCSATTVKRMVEILNIGFANTKYRYGKSNGRRYILGPDDAARVSAILEKTLDRRSKHRAAGRKRGSKL